MPKANIVIALEKPLDKSIANEFVIRNNCNVLREDDTHIYVTETVRNRYKGDDETIVSDLSYGILNKYPGISTIVWNESDY